MNQKMKAWTYERYGKPDEVLELREVDVPTVGDDQVLVRVKAASVNPLDWHWVTGRPLLARIMMGIRRPKRSVAGADLAGIVEVVGKDVTRFRPGGEVFGETVGALAEYAVVSENGLVAKPRT